MSFELPKKLNMGMQPQMTSARTYILEIVLLLVICLLFGWFIVLPKQAALTAEQSKLEVLNQEKSKIDSNSETITRLVGELKAKKAEVEKLDDAIPLEGKSIYLQLLIQQIAASAGVVASDVSVPSVEGVAAGDTELLKDPFAVSRSVKKLNGTAFVMGTFKQLVVFLKKLEASGRVIQISDIEINGTQEDNLSLRIVFEANYLAP